MLKYELGTDGVVVELRRSNTNNSALSLIYKKGDTTNIHNLIYADGTLKIATRDEFNALVDRVKVLEST